MIVDETALPKQYPLSVYTLGDKVYYIIIIIIIIFYPALVKWLWCVFSSFTAASVLVMSR